MSHQSAATTSKPPSSVSSTAESSISTRKALGSDAVVFNVRRSFRSFASSLIVAIKQAAAAQQKGKTSPDKAAAAGKPTKDSLREAVEMTLKERQSFRRAATLLEGKIRGNVKESEALHCCLRSQPCVGGRKRKLSALINAGDGNKA